jgi:hypothetical protein
LRANCASALAAFGAAWAPSVQSAAAASAVAQGRLHFIARTSDLQRLEPAQAY